MTQLTKLIAELREIEKDATPGPWTSCDVGPRGGKGVAVFPKDYSHECDFRCGGITTNRKCSNAILIEKSRNALPTLLDALEEAIKIMKRHRQHGVWLSEDSRKYSGTDAGHMGREIKIDIEQFLKKHGINEGAGDG